MAPVYRQNFRSMSAKKASASSRNDFSSSRMRSPISQHRGG
jgi:hypothetical protein